MSQPSGILTFLFTDIEGSTRRWEADADAMRVALETHNQVLREAVKTHSGQVFNYTGDGMCAVFTSPRSAVDAAVAAQRALELPVRMGIATGEAELRGDDYFGTVLNRTARVMAAGYGGQILLDGATAELLNGVDLIDFGPRRLRDIAKPVHTFQVRAPGLHTEFPPLKTVDATPGNLRPPTTSFVGRDAEVAEVETALKAHRLLTLTGVGGVGKTRLALEIAAGLTDNFPDGVWVIELAAVADGQNSAAGFRQLRTPSRCRRRDGRSDPLPLSDREDTGHQPRGPAGGRRTALARAVTRRRLKRRNVVRRTCFECGARHLICR